MNDKISLPKKIVLYVILLIVTCCIVLPIAYTLFSAFKSNSEILAHPERLFPAEPTLDNFRQALTSRNFNIPLLTFNSLWYTAACVCITLTTASLAGYVFARGDFYGKKLLFTIFSSLMFISFGSITIYATFEVMNFVHIPRSLGGLVITKIFGVGIVNIYLIRGYILSLPKAMDESAEIDGCSFVGIFFRIIAPLLKPILATVAILAFQGSWNDYLMPTIFTMTKPEQRTLIVGIMSLKNSEAAASSWNLMLAGATVSLIPILVAYGFANKYFVSGLAAGAVKG